MTPRYHPDSTIEHLSAPGSPDQAATTLASRLRVVAPVLLARPVPEPDPEPGRDAATLLRLVVEAVQAQLGDDTVWLLLVATQAVFPTADDVREARRHLELMGATDATMFLLDACLRPDRRDSARRRRIELIVDGVVVDVDFAARTNYHTGIQQVIRNTLPLWDRDHEIRLAAWTGPPHRALRAVTAAERDRVLRWHGQPALGVDDDPDAEDAVVLVPWRSVVVIADIPTIRSLGRLAALGEFSGNQLAAVGYDVIPLISTHLVPIGAADHHARYAACIKYAARVAAISETARAEFQGFTSMLPTQGLTGPDVVACVLPADRHDRPQLPATSGPPTVLGVGSLEPRKNHVALLFAAEVLWREGLSFRLRLIGGNRWGQEISDVVDRLVAAGYPLQVEVGVDQDELERAFASARFTVFASIHEGYGLPVAESLAFGTPVVTSDYGSTAEIAVAGGAVLIDPRDDDDLIGAMRTLLTDDAAIDRLHAEIATRPQRTWEDYARDLWDALVAPRPSTLVRPGG